MKRGPVLEAEGPAAFQPCRWPGYAAGPSTWKLPCIRLPWNSKFSSVKWRYNIDLCMVALVVKNPPANAGEIRDTGSIPGSGRSPGEGNDNPLQSSCLNIPWIKEPDGFQVMGSQKSQKGLSG